MAALNDPLRIVEAARASSIASTGFGDHLDEFRRRASPSPSSPPAAPDAVSYTCCMSGLTQRFELAARQPRAERAASSSSRGVWRAGYPSSRDHQLLRRQTCDDRASSDIDFLRLRPGELRVWPDRRRAAASTLAVRRSPSRSISNVEPGASNCGRHVHKGQAACPLVWPQAPLVVMPITWPWASNAGSLPLTSLSVASTSQ